MVTILPSGWPHQISGRLIGVSTAAELADRLRNPNALLRLVSTTGAGVSYIPVRNVVSVITAGGE